MKNINSKDVSDFLGLELHGGTIDITHPAGLNFVGEGALKFASAFSAAYIAELNSSPNNFVIAHPDYSGQLTLPHVISSNPRLDFCRVCTRFFPIKRNSLIEKSAKLSSNAQIGDNIYIGHNVVIEDDVKIGDNTTILHNVVISSGTRIGRNCLIKSGTIIGQKGFGFERDKDGIPVEFIHYGTVKIGDYVEVGALCTVVAGALSDTILEDYCKLDDHVHIAHNVFVGSASCIAACAEISGSVKIGKASWLGPNCSIIDKASLGDGTFVGIGASVTKTFPEKSVVAGNPAKLLRVQTDATS